MKLQEFLKKYTKQIIVVLLFLFAIKFVQSCNRKIEITTNKAEISRLKDSISYIISNNEDTVNALNRKLELANVYKEAADSRADAVQSVAEKITKNTTVKVENNEVK